MDLLRMSLSGAVLIAAVAVIRALTLSRLPKKTFLVLWGIVLFRLLVPFSVPSAFSVYSLMEQKTELEPLEQIFQEQVIPMDASISPAIDDGSQQSADIAHAAYTDRRQTQENITVKQVDTAIVPPVMYHEKEGRLKPVWIMIWCIGGIICATYFAGSYLRWQFTFRTSLPVENAFAQSCLRDYACWRRPVENEKHLFHPVSVRQSDRITTPMTYGIFHPVILMPRDTDWEDTAQLRYVLLHECVHICRFDALTKWIVICALCVHWFNPMVWIMYVLFNRDVEISCDESVVRRMGESSKTAYAMMLIRMEAERSGLAPLCNGFLFKIDRNAMEERITSIMKIKKRSAFAGIAAAVLVIGVAAVFATSAAQTANAKDIYVKNAAAIPDPDFTEEEYDMLLALKFDGYEDMSISEYRNKVLALTDTEKYNDIIDRFFQNERIYAKYETREGTDSDATYDFLYNVLGPVIGEQPGGFSGSAVTDFPRAWDNAALEYTGMLTITDADQLTVREYIWVRHGIMDMMDAAGDRLRDLSVSELRDEELMKTLLDEEVKNIMMTYQNDALQVDMEYLYRPLSGVPVDDMEDWQKERRDEWDRMMEPYVPFGLTYRYDWDTDEYKMYYNGKEVRGIYDGEENVWISEHEGIGKGIYDENATELFVIYEDHEIAGLREATAQEMEEITAKRQAVSEEHKNAYQEIRRTVPATNEDYQSLFTLKTSDYRQKSIADFNLAYLEWGNEDHERMERIGCDRSWNDYRVAMSDEERSFVELTAWLSGMENGEYVRSLKKNEPEQDISDWIRLSSKEESVPNGVAWCSLEYGFSYHISDKEKVRIGERDDQIGKMMREIQDYWDSSEIDAILQMTESDVLEVLQSIAAKYSNEKITITILADQTAFECLDERKRD